MATNTHRLWTIAEPALAAETLLCFAALLTHELRGGLSAVALLYVQSGILVLTTCTALALTVRSVGQESRAVKGALMGCDVMMWGMAFVGFVRAVVVWKAEGEREEREVHGDAGHGAGPWKQ